MNSVKTWQQMILSPSVFMAASFVSWVFIFWPFISGVVPFTSDAVSYYDHTRFFIDQLCRGTFPLWDPHWGGGLPNDFFLRRIGPYNPFLFLAVILKHSGVPLFYAYMFFLVVYFFVGMVGFYQLARKVLRNRYAAFLSFAVLTFSALGTRLFDSYMLLVTVPVIWFFYFLVSFFSRPSKAAAAGVTLTLVLLLTTYIPLYFVFIVLFFLLVYLMASWRDVAGELRTAAAFTRDNKLFLLGCLLVLLTAVLPGLSFFTEAGKGGVAIPGRHYNTDVKHVLSVEPQTLSPWSIMEEFFFSSYYTDLTRIAFAIVYVPIFAFVVLGMGLFIRVTRLFLVLVLWAMLLILFSMPIGFPMYEFLYQKFGAVKYFRNLHFFLWFALLPIFALFVGVVWRGINEWRREVPSWVFLLFALLVHGIGFVLLFRQGDALFSSYLALALSGVLWSVIIVKDGERSAWIMPLMFLTVILQPVEVFIHLSDNYKKEIVNYVYDKVDGRFSHTTSYVGEARIPSLVDVSNIMPDGRAMQLYYTTAAYQHWRGMVNARPLERYEFYKFYLYDRQPVKDDIAAASSGEPVKADSDRFRVTKFSANGIELNTSLESSKFVVYNDVNYPGWKLTINGKPGEILTANGVYKGFWLPAGVSNVSMRYGSVLQYALNWFLLIVTYALFVYTIVLFWRVRRG